VPVVGGVSPAVRRMVVDLPAALGPRNRDASGFCVEGDLVDGGEGTVPLGDSFDGDHLRSLGCLAVRSQTLVSVKGVHLKPLKVR
jgi:hypothetical protein